MKKGALLGFVLSLLVLMGTDLSAQMAEDVQKHPACSYCGMNRQQFSHSRMLIHYDDDTSMGACSIHCAAIHLAINMDKTPRSIQVADYKSKKLIEAEHAIWVIGGNKPGVMTKRAKWAFEKKEDAEEFVKEDGGAMAGFDEAMAATYEDMYNDTKMIREKRAMRRKMQSGGQPQGTSTSKPMSTP